jgi:hypothetical protein
MLTALVLICSTGVPDIQHCTRDSASTVIRVPAEFASPAACLMHGQAYLAATSIGRELGQNDRVTIVCVPTKTIDASVHEPSVK